MKKVLIAALALMVGASLSLAGMGIQWSANGWMAEYGGNVNDGPGVADNNNVIWQLIYAGADNTANAPDLSAAPNYLSGDDELLADRQIPAGGGTAADGSSWDGWLMQQGGETVYEDLDWNTAGSVYQRIWQGTPSVDDGGYYFETALFNIDTGYAGGGAAPQEFNYDPDGNGVVVDNYIPGEGPGPQPQVPEPATMSLLGLGALAMVLRRKLRK